MHNILHIQMGGTIDKFYPNRPGAYSFVIDEAAVQRMSVCNQLIKRQVSVCKLDSQDIDKSERESLVKVIDESEEKLILVTHGTDAMIETGRYLLENVPSGARCIVITGSKQPWSMKDSDAEFNVGMAIGALIALENTCTYGVFIVIDGDIIPVSKVQRNDKGTFYKET